MTSPRFFALVPAAGVGERSGAAGPKQYVPIAGRPMLAHTLAALAAVPRIAQTLVVLSPADDRFEAALPGCAAWVARVGGASRAESVLGGLAELRRRGATDDDWVLVHDAARCLLRPEWVDALIDACATDAVGGLLAQPVADTLKAGDADGRVTATVDRRDKWAAQTPQMFRLGLVERALQAMGAAATDEASAVEALGLAPRLVRASMANFKVTWPEDFALAERLLTAGAASDPAH
ncbi:MAG TPA: 2-C-methyl-D-erythritol 4-phosphate cytidylyltransferase [Roseateles sp.]